MKISTAKVDFNQEKEYEFFKGKLVWNNQRRSSAHDPMTIGDSMESYSNGITIIVLLSSKEEYQYYKHGIRNPSIGPSLEQRGGMVDVAKSARHICRVHINILFFIITIIIILLFFNLYVFWLINLYIQYHIDKLLF